MQNETIQLSDKTVRTKFQISIKKIENKITLHYNNVTIRLIYTITMSQ
jgi:hypothetical protein